MKILNLHGYKGDPHNAAYHAMNEVMAQKGGEFGIISPAVDHDNVSPEELFEDLQAVIREQKPDILVGTSLGGFYAGILSAGYDLPVILINPCLMPFDVLPRLGYVKSVKPFMTLFGRLMKLREQNVCTVVGGRDEIIDTPELTRSMLENPRFILIPEGMHSGATLPLRDCFERFLPYITELRGALQDQ